MSQPVQKKQKIKNGISEFSANKMNFFVKKMFAALRERVRLVAQLAKVTRDYRVKNHASSNLFAGQVNRAVASDGRYLHLIARLVEDNSGRPLQMKLTEDGYIKIQNLKPVPGTILDEINQSMILFHLVLLNYRDGKVHSFDDGSGGLNGDHMKDKLSNNPYSEVRLVAFEINLFRKSEGKTENDFKVGGRFGLPLHTTIFDCETKTFKAPFNPKMLRRTSAGRKLVDNFKYYPGATRLGSTTWATSKGAACRKFKLIVKLVCKVFIDAIEGEGGDEFCKAMGNGWCDPAARANNLEYLRERMNE